VYIKLLIVLLFVLSFFPFAFSQHTGDVIFEKSYGGTAYDEIMSVTENPLGGFIAAGFTQSYGLGRWGDAFFVKTNSNGDSVWTFHLGGDGMDVFADLITTQDSMFVATGLTDTPNDFENIYLVKISDSGSIIWEKNFGGSLKEVAQSLTNALDGGIVITGVTKSFGAGEEDLFIFKTTIDGDSLWLKTYGTTGNDGGYGITPTSDGGYIIAGQYNWSDLWLLKTDSDGDTLWTSVIGGVDYEEGLSVKETADGGYIICGSTASFGAGQLDVYLVKTDSNGKVDWQKTFGGSGYEEGRRVIINNDNGYILMANTDGGTPGEFDYLIIWTDLNGDTIKTISYGDAGEDRCYDMISVDSDYLLIAASNYNPHSDGDASLLFIYKNDVPTNVNDNHDNTIEGFYLSEAYPNPFNPSTTIHYQIPQAGIVILKIYDILGNEVATLVNEEKSAGKYNVNFNASSLSSGVYIYKIQTSSFINSKKMILLK
jgi:hypothetical protein